MGYRAFDTAQMYGNEDDVGRALKETGIPRGDLCVTTKVHPDNFSVDKFLPSVEASLEALQTDYVDVLLLHWPPIGGDVGPSLELLAQAHERGAARNVGVSNYTAQMMRDAKSICDVPIVTNQVEFHPLLNQDVLVAAATETGIPLSSFSSLARGKVLEYPIFDQIGRGYGKTAGQVALRWIVQKGVSLNTMSANPKNIRANYEIMDFTLSSIDMDRIDAMTATQYRLVTVGPRALGAELGLSAQIQLDRRTGPVLVPRVGPDAVAQLRRRTSGGGQPARQSADLRLVHERGRPSGSELPRALLCRLDRRHALALSVHRGGHFEGLRHQPFGFSHCGRHSPVAHGSVDDSWAGGRACRSSRRGEEGALAFKAAERRFRDVLIPLGVPVFVGPGSIATVILYADKAPDRVAKTGLALVILAIAIATFVVLLSGRWAQKALGDTGLDIATRILGLFLAAMGVQFMIDGLNETQLFRS